MIDACRHTSREKTAMHDTEPDTHTHTHTHTHTDIHQCQIFSKWNQTAKFAYLGVRTFDLDLLNAASRRVVWPVCYATRIVSGNHNLLQVNDKYILIFFTIKQHIRAYGLMVYRTIYNHEVPGSKPARTLFSSSWDSWPDTHTYIQSRLRKC